MSGYAAFPKARRVLRPSEFRTIYETGVRMTSRYFAAFCLKAQKDEPARFGFTVPRALGKSVQRNRIKRRMRAALQTQIAAAPPGLAIVFNPRRAVSEAPFNDICREVERILARCKQS